MNKLDTTIKQLIADKNIKTKWSEIEIHGLSEFVNLLFQEQMEYGSIAHTIMVEDRVVCMNLLDGIPYKSEEGQESIVRIYIDINDNLIFLSRKGSLYLYETEGVDAEDLRHYFGQD